MLNSVVEYTNIPVYGEEVVTTADSAELFSFPFIFMTGHKLVRFNAKERAQRGNTFKTEACCSPTTAITTSPAFTRRHSNGR